MDETRLTRFSSMSVYHIHAEGELLKAPTKNASGHPLSSGSIRLAVIAVRYREVGAKSNEEGVPTAILTLKQRGGAKIESMTAIMH